MSRIDAVRLGLTSGLLIGAAHLAWAVLVATGTAPWLMDLIFHLHFIRPPFEIERFDLAIAALLVALTTLIGFVAGWMFATLWNLFARVRPDALAR